MWNVGMRGSIAAVYRLNGTAAHGLRVCWSVLSVKVERFVQDTFPQGNHMASYPILPYPTLSYPTLSYPVASDPILSYPILSHPILSHPMLLHVLD